MELFLLYVWMKLTTISVFFGVIGLITITTGFIYLIHKPSWGDWKGRREGLSHPDYIDNHMKVNLPKMWRNIWIGLSMIVFAALLPNQNQVAVLVGTHYALELGKSPEGQKIVSIVRAKANSYLDEQLKELVEENKPKETK